MDYLKKEGWRKVILISVLILPVVSYLYWLTGFGYTVGIIALIVFWDIVTEVFFRRGGMEFKVGFGTVFIYYVTILAIIWWII